MVLIWTEIRAIVLDSNIELTIGEIEFPIDPLGRSIGKAARSQSAAIPPVLTTANA